MLPILPPFLDQIRFLWVRSVTKRPTSIGINVAREVCKYLLAIPQLYSLTPTSLQQYNWTSSQWGSPTPLDGAFDWDGGSRYLLLDESRLFCCGKGMPHTGTSTPHSRLYLPLSQYPLHRERLQSYHHTHRLPPVSGRTAPSTERNEGQVWGGSGGRKSVRVRR